MSAIIIDGRSVAASVNADTAAEVRKLKARGVHPGLAVVLVGNDPASEVYVGSKIRKCGELGIRSVRRVLGGDASMEDVLAVIGELNRDDDVHGILVQSPVPPHLDESAIVAAIDPDKDVDCFHPVNVGRLLIGEQGGFVPCTPQGVIELLKRYRIDPAGRHVVVVGRSNIVGKPLVALLLRKAEGGNATVTCVHSFTADLAEHTRRADILVAAAGRPEFIGGDMIKRGAVVVDVGVNRVRDDACARGYRLVGDVDFKEAAEVASYLTPVPGGVGPMTIAMLMRNALRAAVLRSVRGN